jgi:hypothetical protein
MEIEFINYIDCLIKQIERLKIEPIKEIESGYFNLYCISDNMQIYSLGGRKRKKYIEEEEEEK